jgi:hypothetical protein
MNYGSETIVPDPDTIRLSDPDPYWESRSALGIQIRIQAGRDGPKKGKIKKFIV